MRSEPAFAAIDWGTTRLRAWLLDAAGEIVSERRSDEGLLAVPRERFAAVLDEHLAAMGAAATLPVMMCGMVGLTPGLDRGALCRDTGALRRDPGRGDCRSRHTARHPHHPRRRAARQRAPRRDARRGDAACRHRQPARRRPPGVHARHALQMGQHRGWRGHAVRDLADRRAVFGAVDAVDPAPCARPQPAQRFRLTIRCSGTGWRMDWRIRAIPFRGCSGSAPRRCCSTCSRMPPLPPCRACCSATRSPRRAHNSRAPVPISCWSLPEGSATSTPKRWRRPAIRQHQVDAETAVRKGLLEAARRNFGLDAGRRATA